MALQRFHHWSVWSMTAIALLRRDRAVGWHKLCFCSAKHWRSHSHEAKSGSTAEGRGNQNRCQVCTSMMTNYTFTIRRLRLCSSHQEDPNNIDS